MFRNLANRPGGVASLIVEPSLLIAARLEAIWATRTRARLVSGIPMGGSLSAANVGDSTTTGMWDHLIYAYLIENTRAPEIFRRVIFEATHGERLGILQQPATYNWLRVTEDLFEAFGPPFVTYSTVSQVRPDAGATRRNAYYRMFGMDLNHPLDGGRAYEKAAASNRDFVATFEGFLREMWRAIENVRNTSGANQTDLAAAADYALRLQNMLNERRGGSSTGPNLAREEFAAVAAMSWLHLILDSNNAVVTDLQSTAASPEERLRRVGERVGVASHSHSHSYFILAPLASQLLILIEDGYLSTSGQLEAMYLVPLPPASNPQRDRLMSIIDHWSRATGRNLKAVPVAASSAGTPPAPTAGRPPAATTVLATGATNGRSPAPVARETAGV